MPTVTTPPGYLPTRDIRLGDLRPGEAFIHEDGTPGQVQPTADMLRTRIAVQLHPDDEQKRRRWNYSAGSRVAALTAEQAADWDARYPEKRRIR